MTAGSAVTIHQQIENYLACLVVLEEVAGRPSVEQILDVLLARDRVQLALNGSASTTSEELTTLRALDNRLRAKSEMIGTVLSTQKWRETVQPAETAWWWFLQPPTQEHWSKRFGWIWNAVAVLWLGATLFLIFDMVPRFPYVGPDAMNTLVQMTQMAIGILAAGGALTLAGRKIIDNTLLGLRLPKRYVPEAKLVLAILALGVLITLRLSLPSFARFYNNRGVVRHHNGEITYALQDYERALKLEPDFIEVHYNLGLLYEDLGDYSHAQIEYRYAIEGDLDLAYVNLSRLYILENKFSQAALLLERHLRDVDEADVRYDVLKNLGWARLGQERFSEAASYLEMAIAQAPDKAPAHCLLALTYEGMENTELAMDEWEQCLAYASVLLPDEDTWIGMARKRFEVE